MLFINISCNDDTLDLSKDKEELPENTVNGIPQIVINTNGATIVDDPKIIAEISISEEGIISYNGKIGIEIRGASSQMFPKKSYGLETRDSNNQDLDVSLLGLPEEEDWILYAPYTDKSLMRNMLTYDLSRDLGQYASRSVFVELTINNEYKGVYVFMEKLKRDALRIDINKLKPDENSGEAVTGGYILKIDKTAGNNAGGGGYNNQNSFVSQYTPNYGSSQAKIHFLYEYPDAVDITSEQKTYISSYISNFEDALKGDNFQDPNSGYATYIDVPSFIDFFLINELSNNVDGYRISTYMHKDKNKKLKMGPIWDFNLAFGNADYCSGGDSNVWAYKFNERCGGDGWLVPFWWNRLMQDPAYVAQVKQRWAELRSNTFSEAAIMEKLDSYRGILNAEGAINQNFETWDILGLYIWPNNFIGTSYAEEHNYLKQWIQDRLIWLDGAIDAL